MNIKRVLLGLLAAVVLTLSVAAAPAHATVTPRDNSGPHNTVQIISLTGGCLDIHTATVGSRLTNATCGSAGDLWWEYTSGASAGQISPQGHPGISVGDAGGLLELRTAPSTPVTWDSDVNGYVRLCFLNQSVGGCVNATYWHSNGGGNNVTLTGTRDNSDYWLLSPA